MGRIVVSQFITVDGVMEDPGGSAVMYWSARSWVMNKKIKGLHASGSLWGGFKHETTWYDAEG